MDELDGMLGDSEISKSTGGIKVLPNATAVLVLGILSIVGCFLYGIPGLILGIIALVLHKKNKELYGTNPPAYEASYKNAKAGYVCAIIGVALSAAYFLFFIFFIGAFFTAMNHLPVVR